MFLSVLFLELKQTLLHFHLVIIFSPHYHSQSWRREAWWGPLPQQQAYLR